MEYGLPIFTSDIWFARSVCGEAAKYFDPLNAANILRALDEVPTDPYTARELMLVRQIKALANWEGSFAAHERYVAQLLTKDTPNA